MGKHRDDERQDGVGVAELLKKFGWESPEEFDWPEAEECPQGTAVCASH